MPATKIEWTDFVWNPVTGCSKVSRGCEHCYANRSWPRLAAPGQPYAGRSFTDVQCHPHRIEEPLRAKKPRKVFVASMGDLFHKAVPDAFISRVFAVMCLAKAHTFQVLTKRPDRMLQFLANLRPSINGGFWFQHWSDEMNGRNLALPWPASNVWLGVSVEDQQSAEERIPLLLQTPAAVRFVSAEPLLAPIDLDFALQESVARTHTVDWIIAGGESGGRARPMRPSWIRSIRDQCQDVRVPFFFKQWGEWSPVHVYDDGRFHGGSAYESSLGGRCSASGGRFRRWSDVEGSERVGRKAAGCLLDGRTWDEYPRSGTAEELVGHRLQESTPA